MSQSTVLRRDRSFPAGCSIGGASWLLAQAKTGRELLARVHLQRQGFEVFLPLERRTVRHARQVKQSLAAYFPGYLFVHVDEARQSSRPINSTVGVLRLVCGPEGRPQKAPLALIEALRSACDGEGVAIARRSWRAGDVVRLAHGHFADQLGLVERDAGADRVKVLLSMMSGDVGVVVPVSDLASAWNT